jgi:hypothetical protein
MLKQRGDVGVCDPSLSLIPEALQRANDPHRPFMDSDTMSSFVLERGAVALVGEAVSLTTPSFATPKATASFAHAADRAIVFGDRQDAGLLVRGNEIVADLGNRACGTSSGW